MPANFTPPHLGRVYMFMDRYLEFVDQNNALLNAAFESTIEQKNYNQFLTPAYDSNRLIVTVLLKEAVASGECRSDLDIDYIALSLLAALQSNLFTLQRHVLGFSLERIKAGIRQLFEGILA